MSLKPFLWSMFLIFYKNHLNLKNSALQTPGQANCRPFHSLSSIIGWQERTIWGFLLYILGQVHTQGLSLLQRSKTTDIDNVICASNPIKTKKNESTGEGVIAQQRQSNSIPIKHELIIKDKLHFSGICKFQMRCKSSKDMHNYIW